MSGRAFIRCQRQALANPSRGKETQNVRYALSWFPSTLGYTHGKHGIAENLTVTSEVRRAPVEMRKLLCQFNFSVGPTAAVCWVQPHMAKARKWRIARTCVRGVVPAAPSKFAACDVTCDACTPCEADKLAVAMSIHAKLDEHQV